MKKLIIIILFSGVTLSAVAQKFVPRGGHRYAPRPRVSVGVGIGAPFYGWGYGYGPGYPYYGYGYPFYPGGGYSVRPSRLSLEIEDIQNNYQAHISEVRHDKSLPRKERKKEIRQLKAARDKEIIEAKRRYYSY
jgi:hypothetical protein